MKLFLIKCEIDNGVKFIEKNIIINAEDISMAKKIFEKWNLTLGGDSQAFIKKIKDIPIIKNNILYNEYEF